MAIQDRFIRYAKIDTQSNEESLTSPSSLKQLDLACLLVKELQEMGLSLVELDEYGIVYGTLNGNIPNGETIGLIAHMDTATDMTGTNVQPRIIDYQGGAIVLHEKDNIVMDNKTFPSLNNHIGNDLIVTDGKTLLGADDKAGIAIIMETLDYLIKNPHIPHGTIKIAFTPDEEIGRGTDHFDVKKFAADYAYTIDGGEPHHLNVENFNASSAHVIIKGVSIHPGTAKDKMVNASLVAMEFDNLLPKKELPSLTEDREGFHHLISFQGQCEHAEMHYIIRNHERKILERQKKDFIRASKKINRKYGYKVIEVEIRNSYSNMYDILKNHEHVVSKVTMAMERLGLTPVFSPIRGGTDGARLTYLGLPTPNLGTGGYNCHGKYEYVVIQEMELMVELLLEIVKI